MRKKINGLLIFTLALQIFACAPIGSTGPVSVTRGAAPPTSPPITATPFLPATASPPPSPTETSSPTVTPSPTATATLTPTLTASPTIGLILLASELPVFPTAAPTVIKKQNESERHAKGESRT